MRACYLDMDGVLADFMHGALRAHDMDTQLYKNNVGYHGCGELSVLLGMEKRLFYSVMDYNFWRELRPMEDYTDIAALCEMYFGRENVFICSSPSKNWGCMEAKRDWLARWLPNYRNRFIFTEHKYAVSGKGRVLVDDWDKNCAKWGECGGKAVLVPRLWNSRHAEAGRAASCVRDGIEAALALE